MPSTALIMTPRLAAASNSIKPTLLLGAVFPGILDLLLSLLVDSHYVGVQLKLLQALQQLCARESVRRMLRGVRSSHSYASSARYAWNPD